jgi:hypothetical protein
MTSRNEVVDRECSLSDFPTAESALCGRERGLFGAHLGRSVWERKECSPLVSLHSAEPQDERAPSAGAKSLAIPFDQTRWTPIEDGKTKCVGCGQDAKRWTMFGRSY